MAARARAAKIGIPNIPLLIYNWAERKQLKELEQERKKKEEEEQKKRERKSRVVIWPK